MGNATSKHVHVAGRLVVNPTTLTPAITGPNCGGTQLGTVQRLAFRTIPRIDPITAQEYGSETIDGILLGHELLLEGYFYGWDTDQVQAILYGSTAGAGSIPLVTYHGAEVGSSIESGGKANVLLWIPNDELNNPAILCRRAVPFEISEPIYFAGRQPMVIRASWLLLRDSSDRRAQIGLLSELAGV